MRTLRTPKKKIERVTPYRRTPERCDEEAEELE